MKKIQIILFICLLASCGTLDNKKEKSYNNSYFDEFGEAITSQEFQTRWRDKSKDLVRWDFMKNSGRVSTLKKPVYSQYLASYPSVLKKLETQTGKIFAPGTIFLLEYTYLNDLCSINSTNNWNKTVISSRKKFTSPNKEEIEAEHKNVVVLNFFEQGILLKNEPSSPGEYYFSDNDNFLRKNFFKDESFCGSYALIKPDGTTLVRNGEYTAKLMIENLQPAIWEHIFTE